jgi:hypothetical protein
LLPSFHLYLCLLALCPHQAIILMMWNLSVSVSLSLCVYVSMCLLQQ